MFRKQISKAKERIESQSLLLETKFGSMEYAIQGKGQPVLLIHGAGGGFDQGLWLGQISLQKGYQFIAPSKFGYLNSDTPREYSAKHQAEQYEILLNYLNIEKVIVVAVSAGGPSAMAHYPNLRICENKFNYFSRIEDDFDIYFLIFSHNKTVT